MKLLQELLATMDTSTLSKLEEVQTRQAIANVISLIFQAMAAQYGSLKLRLDKGVIEVDGGPYYDIQAILDYLYSTDLSVMEYDICSNHEMLIRITWNANLPITSFQTLTSDCKPAIQVLEL